MTDHTYTPPTDDAEDDEIVVHDRAVTDYDVPWKETPDTDTATITVNASSQTVTRLIEAWSDDAVVEITILGDDYKRTFTDATVADYWEDHVGMPTVEFDIEYTDTYQQFLCAT